MKKLPLRQKFRQFRLLIHILIFSIILQTVAQPLQAAEDFLSICSQTMAEADPAKLAVLQQEQLLEKERVKRERRIQQANQRIKLQKFDFNDYQSTVDHYKANPEKFKDWFEDLKLRYDRGAAKPSELFAAASLTDGQTDSLMADLLDRNNLWVKSLPFYRFESYLGIQENQTVVERQFILSKLIPRLLNSATDARSRLHILTDGGFILSKLPQRIIKLALSVRFYRGYNILLPREVEAGEPRDLSINYKENTNFNEFLVSLKNSIYIAKDGGDPRFAIRNWKRTINAFKVSFAAAPEAFYDQLTNLLAPDFSDADFHFVPVRKLVRAFVAIAYPSSKEINNFPNDLAQKLLHSEELKQSPIVLDNNEANVANKKTDLASYFADLYDKTAIREFPKTIANFIATIIGLYLFAEWLHGYLFAGGAAAKFNGKYSEDNYACTPTSTQDDEVLGPKDINGLRPKLISLDQTHFSPFDDIFIKPRKNPGHEGQPNPCDILIPGSTDHISDFYKKILEANPENPADDIHDRDLLIWERDNSEKLNSLWRLIQNAYNYTSPQFTACSKYVSWYQRCGPGAGRQN